MRLTGFAHSSFNLFLPPRNRSFRDYASYRLRAGFFFLFNFFILVFAFYLFYTPLHSFRRWNSSKLLNKKYNAKVSLRTFSSVYLTIRSVNTFYKTVQRAPMAHRQWSQEQYRFKFFRFRLVAKLPLLPTLLINSNHTAFFNEMFSALAFRSSLISFYRLLFTRKVGFQILLN